MIISKTPFRVSFFGGGTDYPVWFREHGGAVLSTSINRYCYISCRYLPPFFDYKHRIVWSNIETVGDTSEIKHPVVRGVLNMMDISEGIEIHHNGDLPSRAGLGSSSSFTVGILNALHALKGKMLPKEELAKLAIYVEQDVLKESVGVQDQIAATYGGFNKVEIYKDNNFSVQPISISQEKLTDLQDHMVLFYTGVSRIASEIAAEQIKSIPDKTAELTAMREMVDEAVKILANGSDIKDFGRLLHESWQLKKSLTQNLAPSFVDEIYNRAQKAGALGGKLLGAGGGGFILFFVEPEKRGAVLDALEELLMVPIQFETGGSQIIFYQPEQYSQTALHEPRFKRYYDNND